LFSTPSVAYDLYELATALPGTSTNILIKEQTEISIDGPFSEQAGNILTAVNNEGVPLLVKVLRGTETNEAAACSLLELHNAETEQRGLAHVEVKMVSNSADDMRGTDITALIMPQYARTLSDMPQLPINAIRKNIPRIISALQFIHSRGLVHMDVKSANIFVTYRGEWVLGDFDATVNVGGPILKYTERFYPNKLDYACPTEQNPAQRTKVPATTSIDYYMLLG
jgi:serine/threonine protein kinase